MRVSRVVSWASASLFALLLLFLLEISGCQLFKPGAVKQQGKRTLDCATEVDVDVTNGVIKKHEAVYVCADPGFQYVTWTIPQNSGVTKFTVQFPNGCPFTSCTDLTETNPRATVLAPQPGQTYDLTVYKYTITVNNGTPHDPHVVGGGGS